MQPLLLWKSSEYYTTWVCVFVALGIHAMRMRHIDLSPATFYSFPHCLINGTIFENKFLNTNCVYWFSLQFLSETFLILRRNERDIIKMYISLHVKYPLFVTDFNKTWIFRTDFRKLLKYKISWKSVKWEPSCSMRTYRQTDRHDEALRNLANAPNNEHLATDIFLQISNHCWVCALITKEGHSEKTCAHGQTVTTWPQSDGAATY
jgi:hypothetical protein